MKALQHEAPITSNFVSVVETQRLLTLEAEQRTLVERMRQIQAESDALFTSLRARIAPQFFSGEVPTTSQKHQPDNPRPISHKLAISAGRAIVVGIREGLTPEQSREAALNAATRVAKKYGMDALPDLVVSSIDKKIRVRYNLFGQAELTGGNAS
jgi:hypothetical protein